MEGSNPCVGNKHFYFKIKINEVIKVAYGTGRCDSDILSKKNIVNEMKTFLTFFIVTVTGVIITIQYIALKEKSNKCLKISATGDSGKCL